MQLSAWFPLLPPPRSVTSNPPARRSRLDFNLHLAVPVARRETEGITQTQRSSCRRRSLAFFPSPKPCPAGGDRFCRSLALGDSLGFGAWELGLLPHLACLPEAAKGPINLLPLPYSLCSLNRQQVFDVPVGVKIVHAFLLATGAVKRFLVEEHRNLVRIKVQVQHLQVLRVLAIEQTVPGVARTGLFKDSLPVRGTTQRFHRAEIIRQHHLHARQRVGRR